MSSSLSHSHCFLHVHVRELGGEVGCAWYAFNDEDGAWLSTCALEAEAVKTQDCAKRGITLATKFPLIVGMVFVPCTNDVLTDEQKRLIHVV